MDNKDNKTISEKDALSRMMRICARKEYSTFDIKQKLYKLNLSNDEIDSIIAKLIENKFIDNERYTRSFINDRIRFSKWGIVKIKYSLKQKQISESIINNILDEYDPDLLTDHLTPILKQKMATVKGKTEYEKRAKVIRFALGRGFEMSDIAKHLDKISTIDDDIW